MTDLSIAQRIADALIVPCGDGKYGFHGASDSLSQECVNTLASLPNPLPALEIGPGMGVLTQYLLERPEVDLRMVEIDTESVNYLLIHFPQVQPEHHRCIVSVFHRLLVAGRDLDSGFRGR